LILELLECENTFFLFQLQFKAHIVIGSQVDVWQCKVRVLLHLNIDKVAQELLRGLQSPAHDQLLVVCGEVAPFEHHADVGGLVRHFLQLREQTFRHFNQCHVDVLRLVEVPGCILIQEFRTKESSRVLLSSLSIPLHFNFIISKDNNFLFEVRNAWEQRESL